MNKITYLVFFLLFFNGLIFAQNKTTLEKAQEYLKTKGEVVFTFKANSQSQFEEINKIVSISHKKIDGQDLQVEAYATKEQFKKFLAFGLSYNVTVADNEILKEPASLTNKTMATWDTSWNAYPKYSEYVAKMQYWATTYPNLCTLQAIGSTPNGRTLYILKISDNASSDETEPEFLYTSSMHGDEITGYPTMLRFIDYLLTNYSSNAEVSNIVNGTEIFICPLANPDGSYKTAGNDIMNSTGNTATRANANGYDLNRNYPDPLNGLHPDSGLQTNPVYQPETQAFLAFERTRNFVLSANYHGGAEVINFPWDTYPTTGGANIHPHDNYFKYISTEYASLCQTADGNNLYMDDVYGTGQFPGTTNGSAWYTISGGRQDYNNYFNHNKEMTIEISVTKFPVASNLPTFWNNNKQAILNYVKQANYGLHGVVTDATGNPIHTKVYINGYDLKGSWVETSATKGDYHKVLIAGTYTVIFEAPGYTTQTQSITVTNGAASILNITMVPTTSFPVANYVTICQGQTTTLSASGTGTIKWYTTANATTPLATGSTFTTPSLNINTSYFTESEITLPNVGSATASGTSSNNTAVANRYMIFNCTTPTKLKSVLVNASAVGQILVELQDKTGTMLESKVVLITSAGSQDIDLDFFLPAQNDLRLVSRQLSYTNLTVATSGITYPLTNGTISITANSGTGTFFPFFNWKFSPLKSNRDEVVVTVKPNPTSSSISPTSKLAGGTAFTLTVNGSNFINGESIVRWNGIDRATTYISPTELTAEITADDIASGGTANVTIFNTCNTTVSNSQLFTIQAVCNIPVPNVASLPDATGQCSVTVTAPTATSSCLGTITGTTTNPLTYNKQGTYVITWTYNDNNGNTTIQDQTVIVDDTTAPIIPVLAEVSGQNSVTLVIPTTTDACGGTITGTTTTIFPITAQGTTTLIWTFDDANGQFITANQNVVIDATPPTATISLIATATTQTTTNLSWAAATDNIAVTGYDVYQGTTLKATVTTTSYSVAGLSASTAYTFSVKAKDAVGNISVTSNVASITTLAPLPTYCTSQGNSVANEKIGTVVIGTINNTTTGATGYENYTALSTNTNKGTVCTITITPSWTSTKRKEGYAVWIDYNGDGDFADAGEQVWTKAASTTTPASGTFTIPSTAVIGATRMRVSMKYNAIPTSCETFASGQVEDYTINIVSSSAKMIVTSKSIASEIILYPNPTTSILNITSTSENTTFKIYNLIGQTVLKGKINDNIIDVSNINQGNYILEITDKETTILKRFIKQ